MPAAAGGDVLSVGVEARGTASDEPPPTGVANDEDGGRGIVVVTDAEFAMSR